MIPLKNDEVIDCNMTACRFFSVKKMFKLKWLFKFQKNGYYCRSRHSDVLINSNLLCL